MDVVTIREGSLGASMEGSGIFQDGAGFSTVIAAIEADEDASAGAVAAGAGAGAGAATVGTDDGDVAVAVTVGVAGSAFAVAYGLIRGLRLGERLVR